MLVVGVSLHVSCYSPPPWAPSATALRDLTCVLLQPPPPGLHQLPHCGT